MRLTSTHSAGTVLLSLAALAAAPLGGCDGQTGSGGGAAATGSASSPSQPGATESTPASPRAQSIARAREVLAEVGRIYREAPALTDRIALSIRGNPQEMKLRFSRDNKRIEMSLPTATATVIDGTLYMTSRVMYDVYFETEVEIDAASAIAGALGWVPPYHFAMRTGDGNDVDAYLTGLGLGVLHTPRLHSHAMVADSEESGREWHRVTLEAMNGVGHVYIDASTNLVTHISMEVLPSPGQPADAPPIQVLVKADPQLVPELPEPIVFEAGDRERVYEAHEMRPRPVRVGDRAPNFRLATLDGEVVDLREMRGEVVVVDFWATWCIPCIHGLPLLDRFARWAEEEGQPVRVFAVNTMENAPTKEERRSLAERFWRERDFVVSALLDEESMVVARYGHTNLPVTIVIDPRGRVSRIHEGFSRNMFQILKADMERALRRAAEGESGEPE